MAPVRVNQERPNEAFAKQIVERVMAVELDHADTHGGVDYLSPDGTVALEVTAVTDGEKQGAREALRKSVKKGAPNAPLQGCWIVFLSDTTPGSKTIVQRVQPAIVELELAGEMRFEDQRAGIHVNQKGGLSHIYRPLLEAGVERAVYTPHEARPDDPGHVHRLWVTPGSGDSASGSDEALDRLIDELSTKLDNPRKLAATGAAQRHLFVWLNDDTSFTIARPLSHDSPSWAGGDEWGLPRAEPVLNAAITHLWVIHARSRRGWLWDGTRWRELREH